MLSIEGPEFYLTLFASFLIMQLGVCPIFFTLLSYKKMYQKDFSQVSAPTGVSLCRFATFPVLVGNAEKQDTALLTEKFSYYTLPRFLVL